MSNVLLMTGTIDPSSFICNNNNLAVKDVKVRLEQYNSAIKRYITESCFDKIVFVETSNYSFEYESFISLAKENNKEFEYITFMGNIECVQKKGKSYGEAEAILYALKNSRLLANEETIYKVTGRIFLTNSYNIIKTKATCKNEFLSYFKYKDRRCVTYFFKFNKSDYLEYFSNTQELVDDGNGIDIETVYYRKMIKLQMDGKPFEVKPFRCYPRINGIIGGIGVPYDKSKLFYFIEDIMIKMNFFTISE